MWHMVEELGTINLGMPNTTTSPATASTTNVACLIENDSNYQGNDLGSIISVSDYGRCISGCKTAYPSSAYFTYNTFNKDCWCKTSDNGRRTQTGIISGNINCLTTTSQASTNPACLIEYDFNYAGNDLGQIINVSDSGRCISGCKTAHPSSSYFTYRPSTKDCWCKTTDSGRRVGTGFESGQINCQTTTTIKTTTTLSSSTTAKTTAVSTTTTTSPTTVPSGFIIVDDPTNPCDPILSASECEFAAQYLNLPDTTVSNDSPNPFPTFDPPACYLEGGSLKFNDGSNTGSCGVDYNNPALFDQCLCRNIGKILNRNYLSYNLILLPPRNLHIRVMVFQLLGLELWPSEHPARCCKLQKVMQVCEWI